MNTGRYHLVLHTAGRTVQHAGWQSETVARQKLSIWAGDWGREGVRITPPRRGHGRDVDDLADRGMITCHAGRMNHDPSDVQDEDGFDDVLGSLEEAPPLDEHRISTRPAT
jgi:hypothetical protein